MKPILFNTEMVQAILDGRKTVTRRVIKPQPLSKLSYRIAGFQAGVCGYPPKDSWKHRENEGCRLPENITEAERERVWNPPCHAGDILYVRETWAELETVHGTPYYAFKADDETLHHSIGENFTHWHPSIHMPKEAARLFLRVKSVRVERLQDIDGHGILKEGIQNRSSNPAMGARWENMQRMAFSSLWDSTIKSADLPTCGWTANPWVWVIEFERCEKPEATP